jgi:glutamine synthetase
MTRAVDNELELFLAMHPSVRFFDAFVNDLNTIERGKRIDRSGIHKVFAQGMPLPGSMFALDIEGGTVEATGLGFADGDADRPCMPIPGTLVPVPWQSDVAQVQLRMLDHDGTRFFGDPRRILEDLLHTFAALNLTPVIAIEYEFYLVDRERTPEGQPQPPKGPLTGRREFRAQINSMADLNEYSPLLAEIDSTCRLQNVPATSSLAEYGPGQYEVNLAHAADALRVCDEAMRFKRIVKCVARAPGPNSFRRFRTEAYVPVHADWSINNRGSAIRVPASDSANLRIEHRLAGADANPYLVVAWVLAGIHHGLTRQLEPPPVTTGNAYHQPGEPLPIYWSEALERFARSEIARHYFGEKFVKLYATVKRGELEEFASHISPLEIARYLGPL